MTREITRAAQPSGEPRDLPGDPIRPRARGEDARRRLLDAAIEEFAAQGYKGASTRQITARAGVNLGALTYYFGGKPKLYRAALDHILERVNDVIRPIGAAAARALRNPDATALSLRAVLLAFLDQFLDVLLGRTEIEWQPNWAVLLSRAEFEPPEGDVLFFQSVTAAIMDPGTELVARVLGRPGVDEECRLIMLALVGQVMMFRVLPAGQFPAMGWDRIDDQQRDAIRHVIHVNVLALLGARIASASPVAA